jgi:hypothetical protein
MAYYGYRVFGSRQIPMGLWGIWGGVLVMWQAVLAINKYHLIRRQREQNERNKGVKNVERGKAHRLTL